MGQERQEHGGAAALHHVRGTVVHLSTLVNGACTEGSRHEVFETSSSRRTLSGPRGPTSLVVGQYELIVSARVRHMHGHLLGIQ